MFKGHFNSLALLKTEICAGTPVESALGFDGLENQYSIFGEAARLTPTSLNY